MIRSSKRSSKLWSVIAVSCLVAVAPGCSSDSDDGAKSSGNKSENSSGEFELDKPVNIALLWEIEGESTYGTNAYNQGAELAIEELNAKGGVGGHDIESFRIAASPVDPQDSVAALVEAQGKNPTAMIGMASPTQIAAAGGNLERSPIPLIATSVSSPDYVFGSDGGHDNLWTSGVYDPRLASEAVKFLVEDLDAEKIGLMATNEPYGKGGVESAKEELEKLDLEPFASVESAPDATDLTKQVLEMKGADAAFHWGYPGPLSVQLNQFVDNAIDIPTIASTSGLTAIKTGTVKAGAAKKFHLSLACSPGDPSYSSNLEDFVERYEEKWGESVDLVGAWAYDAVLTVAAAVEIAESADPADVNEAISKVNVEDGSGCGGPVKPDGGHVFTHELVITKVEADGAAEVLKTVDTEPVPEGG